MNMFKNIDILSVLGGFASLLDFEGSFIDIEYKKFSNKSDEKIIKNDWNIIGEDMLTSIRDKNE